MGWYLGTIGEIHNDECLIYTFTREYENSTPIKFNKTLYHSYYRESRNNFSPILINTTHTNLQF